MHLNDLLIREGIDVTKVVVMRHRPTAPQLRAVLPWLAAENRAAFNAYQQTQVPTVEKALQALNGQGYIASFIGQKPGKATFAGLYHIASSRPLTREQFQSIPEYDLLDKLGNNGFGDGETRETIEFFDLVETDFYSHWEGKLIIDWPPPERSWWRRAERNIMPISAILEESAFVRGMPAWEEINLSWSELALLPSSWKDALSYWRGIYFIHDQSDGRGYVGSAYGEGNLLGRWLNYAASGHGGNVLLRDRDPTNFRFSILQRLSPDLAADDVIRIEANWKDRLHTRKPHGLNEN